jgi:hypothetical protein
MAALMAEGRDGGCGGGVACHVARAGKRKRGIWRGRGRIGRQPGSGRWRGLGWFTCLCPDFAVTNPLSHCTLCRFPGEMGTHPNSSVPRAPMIRDRAIAILPFYHPFPELFLAEGGRRSPSSIFGLGVVRARACWGHGTSANSHMCVQVKGQNAIPFPPELRNPGGLPRTALALPQKNRSSEMSFVTTTFHSISARPPAPPGRMNLVGKWTG